MKWNFWKPIHNMHVRFPDGRETTVSVKDLAPRGEVTELDLSPDAGGVPEENMDKQPSEVVVNEAESLLAEQGAEGGDDHEEGLHDATGDEGSTNNCNNEPLGLRRSSRTSKPPVRLITQV